MRRGYRSVVRGGLYEVVYKMFSTLSVGYKKERWSQVVTAVIYKSDPGLSSWEFRSFERFIREYENERQDFLRIVVRDLVRIVYVIDLLSIE